MRFSTRLVFDFALVIVSAMVRGLNAAASPNIELVLRKRRRDLSPVSFIVSSLLAVANLFGCGSPFDALLLIVVIKVRNE
jgi:hypothetical protein